MKFNKILKGLICPLLLTAISVKAETVFEKECLEVKDLTVTCEVNSQGKIDYVQLYLDTITNEEIGKLLSYETITRLDLKGKYDKLFFTQEIVDIIGTMKNLEDFDIGDLVKEDKNITFEPFKKLTKVKYLSLWAKDENGEFEKDIMDKFENIENLKLWNTKLDQNDIDIIGSYKNLEFLMLYQVDFEKNLDYSPFKNVKELKISGDNCKIDKNFIKGFKNLKILTIESSQPYIDQSFIDELSNISTIEELNLNFYTDKDLNLNVLKKLENLSNLDFLFYGDTIDVSGFKSLKKLDLRGERMTQDLINIIGELPILETLYITYFADSGDLDFSPLKKIKSLFSLFINGENDKYDHHKKLAKNTLKGFDNIKYLYLERIILKQSDIDDITSLTNLEELEFDFCYLVNGNIDALKKTSKP